MVVGSNPVWGSILVNLPMGLMPCYLEKNQTVELKAVKVMKIIDEPIMSVMVSWPPYVYQSTGFELGSLGV